VGAGPTDGPLGGPDAWTAAVDAVGCAEASLAVAFRARSVVLGARAAVQPAASHAKDVTAINESPRVRTADIVTSMEPVRRPARSGHRARMDVTCAHFAR
jgi:hypothetical protein